MQKSDLIRLRHMLDAAQEISSFIKGKSRTDFDSDRLLVLGIVRALEIVGEAAGKISKGVREKHTRIPWMDIVNMRNHLIHAYYDVDLNIIWDTIQKDIPLLIKQLECIQDLKNGI